MSRQGQLFDEASVRIASAPDGQLLKWIGNKQRMAKEIVSHFPSDFRAYHEPFLGSAAVLATLAPGRGFGSDTFAPLIEIWSGLQDSPELVKTWYAERWNLMMTGAKVERYEEIKNSYNERPNGADLLFLCRACYGGVVRFRRDGYMSTPCGVHTPISPESFARRVDEWRARLAGSSFAAMGFEEAMERAAPGDLVYCDPPYSYSQTIIYGAQDFSLVRLLDEIDRCKSRGVTVALSIDGTKRSGNKVCEQPIPTGLFKRDVEINCGRSMLRRFQMGGKSLEAEVVADRLLLTR